MKKILFLCFFILFTDYVFSETTTLLDSNNEFNGKTEKVLYSPEENQKIKHIMYTYDKNSILRRLEVFLREGENINGVIQQNQFNNSKGECIKYELLFSQEYYDIHGFNRVVEYVNTDKEIIKTEWYINDYKVDALKDSDIINRFPYYKISYLCKQMDVDDYKKTEGNVFSISTKYVGIRSVVLCNGTIEPLNEQDMLKINYIGKSLHIDNITSYYTSKMLIEEDGKKYCMYIQKGLESYFPLQRLTTIRYYFATFNGQLYLALLNICMV